MPEGMKFLGAYARLAVAVGLSLATTALSILLLVGIDALAGLMGMHRLTEGAAIVIGVLLPMVMPIICFLVLYVVVGAVFRRSGRTSAWRAGAFASVAANLLFFAFILAAPQEAQFASTGSGSEFLATLFWLGLMVVISSVLGVGACYLYARFVAAHAT